MTAIDEYCPIVGAIVEPYTCMLNQTDLDSNKNKFYVMQTIKQSGKYVVYIRYGRIGEKGKILTYDYVDENSAVAYFREQFRSKTKNSFGQPFTKYEGKYFLTELAQAVAAPAKATDDDDAAINLDDTIEGRLRSFLDLISNDKLLNDTLVRLKVDPKKMPLGKISNDQLNKALVLLEGIKKKIDAKEDISTVVNAVSTEYYTYMPYSSGRNRPPLLDDLSLIEACIEAIEEMKNVCVTYNIIKNSNKLSRLTCVYNGLDATISALDKNSAIYGELVKYVANTHAPTHNCKLQVIDMYTVSKASDVEYDTFTKDMKNKTLLFHGSPIVNWCSIIKNGLLLDPSKLGVVITGKMFGYGIYWANAISKSFNYCGSYSTNGIAVLAIGEVALGEMYDQYQSNYTLSQKILDGVKKNSTHGVGMSSPNSATTLSDGVIVPNGKLINSNDKKCSLLYDEFIIYNTKQYKIKYLIVVKNGQ